MRWFTMQPQAAYDELLRRSRDEALLESCQAVLGWDELTYMPPGAVQGRAEQLAYLAGLQHDKASDPRVGELLTLAEKAAPEQDSAAPTAVNLREMRRIHERSLKL